MANKAGKQPSSPSGRPARQRRGACDLPVAQGPAPSHPAEGRCGGFYREHLTPEEQRDLELILRASPEGGIEGEIDMVRSVARRVLEMSGEIEEIDKAVKALNSLGCAAVRISRLISEQRSLAASTSEVEEAISIALREIREEFGLDD